MAGRTSIINAKHVEDAAKLAAAGLTISKIALSLGVNERTVYAWMREGKTCADTDLRAQFRQVIHEGWINTGQGYLNSLKQHAANGTTAAATWFLTHHPFFRDDFSDAAAERRVEKRTVSEVLEAIAAAGLSPDDERKVLLQIQARGIGAPAVEAEEQGEADA